jgi:hypothetical protein
VEAATKTLRLGPGCLEATSKSRQGGVASPHALFDTPTIDPGSYHPADMRLLLLALFDHLDVSVGLGSLILDRAEQCLADHLVHDVRHDDSR